MGLFSTKPKKLYVGVTNEPSEILQSFDNALRGLAKKSGFVVVHNAQYQDLRNKKGQIRSKLASFTVLSRPTLIQPKTQGRVVFPFPYPRFPKPMVTPRISLCISLDIVKTEEFKTLMNSYYNDVITRMSADLERRIEFYTQEIESDKAIIKWYKSLSEQDKAKQSDVTLGRIIDHDLGLDLATKESYMPASEYYLKRLPKYLIPENEKQLEKLKSWYAPIAQLQKTVNNPIWKLCLARIFDCAIREIPLCNDRKTKKLYRNWKMLVDGILRIEWRRRLEELNITSSDLFKRTTIFDLDLDEKQNQIRIYPVALIDSARSTVILDKGRSSMLVIDPIDQAHNSQIGGQHGSVRQKLDNLIKNGLHGKDIIQQFFSDPGLITCIFEQAIPPVKKEPLLRNLKESVLTSARSAIILQKYFQLLSIGAQNSANQLLEPEDKVRLSASKALCIAVKNCKELGYAPIQTLKSLRDKKGDYFPSEITNPFEAALKSDRDMVDCFLDLGVISKGGVDLRSIETIVWRVEECREAIRLAKEFYSASNRLGSDHETLDSAFLNAEKAFEAAHFSTFCDGTPSLTRIQRTLSGEPVETDKEN